MTGWCSVCGTQLVRSSCEGPFLAEHRASSRVRLGPVLGRSILCHHLGVRLSLRFNHAEPAWAGVRRGGSAITGPTEGGEHGGGRGGGGGFCRARAGPGG